MEEMREEAEDIRLQPAQHEVLTDYRLAFPSHTYRGGLIAVI